MKGYKGFDENLCCKGFQYEIGKTYELNGELEICNNGFHYCSKLSDVNNYYDLDYSRVCEVEVLGKVITQGDKSCTNKIKIVKELTYYEVVKLINNDCHNRGFKNTGACNTGDYNTGSCNTGNHNVGSWNSGNHNTGDWNSGEHNTGDWNSGSYNTGDCNNGNMNSGSWNSGTWNSGDCNSGDRNSGSWNSGNWNSGFFNRDEPCVRMFEKETNLRQRDIDFPAWLHFDLTLWVSHDTATDEEKEKHKKEIETCGGFLKLLTYEEAFKKAYSQTSDEEKLQTFKLPNFDVEIFKEITGIDTTEEYNRLMNKE